MIIKNENPHIYAAAAVKGLKPLAASNDTTITYVFIKTYS